MFFGFSSKTTNRINKKEGQRGRRDPSAGQEINPSPKLNAVVHDSILLAPTIVAEIERRDA